MLSHPAATSWGKVLSNAARRREAADQKVRSIARPTPPHPRDITGTRAALPVRPKGRQSSCLMGLATQFSVVVLSSASVCQPALCSASRAVLSPPSSSSHTTDQALTRSIVYFSEQFWAAFLAQPGECWEPFGFVDTEPQTIQRTLPTSSSCPAGATLVSMIVADLLLRLHRLPLPC